MTNWRTNTTADISGNGNTGTLVSLGTTTSPMAGKIGQALTFNASNYITTPLVSNATQNIAFSLWVYWKGLTANRQSLFYNGYSCCNGYGILIATGGGSSAAGDKIQLLIGGIAWDALTSNPTLPSNKLVQLTVTRAGTQWTVYVNGVAQGNGTTDPNAPTVGTYIGNDPGNYGFNGAIDDVRIYNRALSPAEVMQLYALKTSNIAHSNTVALSNGLVGYWTFDGSATNWTTNTTRDLSGHGFDAQMVGLSTSTAPVSGIRGQAISFPGTGSDVICAPGTLQTYCTQSLCSMAVWVKPAGAAPSAAQAYYGQGIVGDLCGWIGIYRTNVNGTNDKLWIYNFWDAAEAIPVSYTPDKWIHLTLVHANGTLSAYSNGVLVSTIPSLDTGLTSRPIQIGGKVFGVACNTGTNPPFVGTIDLVRVYYKALTASEVKQLYTLGTANAAHSNTVALSNGLVGYWTFDGSATNWTTNTIADLSGNGYTGRLFSLATTTSPVAGKVGQALNFNGVSSVVDMGDVLHLTAFTYSTWIYVTRCNPAASAPTIMGKWSSGSGDSEAWFGLLSGNCTAELPAEGPPMSELGLLEQLQARLDSVEIPPGNPV